MSSTGGSLQDGSLLTRDQQRSFDVSEEHEVIAFLKAIHQSALETEQKNELRDHIFAYKQNENAAELGLLVESAKKFGFNINAKSIVPLEQKEEAVPQRGTSALGATRPAPRFAQEQQVKADPVERSPQQEPIQARPIASVGTAPAAAVPEVAEEQQTPADETAKQEEVILTPPALDPAARIQEIKRVVNEKVGNPVNLINAHQTIGREYMNALLDAMKKSNGGTSEEIASAMSRLERAFKAVENIDAAPSSQKPEPAKAPAAQIATQTENIAPQVERNDAPPAASSEAARAEIPFVVPVQSVSAQKEPEKEADAPSVARMSSVGSQLQSKSPASQVQAAVSAPASPRDGMHSVAKEKQLQDLLRLDRLKDAQTKKAQIETQIGSMDPLETPEVTSGLEQLLSEWALFKSSGIFGSGPNGKEHPLYKKIGPMTMAAVIAGRFDGATPQVKQSITDYMNGWRYEEGVVHEHGETFEHYLRRVVRHILSKHQNR